MSVPTIAFFDVDETVITVKSMFRFLEFYLAATGRPPEEYRRIRAELKALTESGMSREDTNRRYYRSFAGEPVARVRELGQDWFDQERRAGGLFHLATVGSLALHHFAGHKTVLVSGSFPPCVQPVATAVGADAVLCTVIREADAEYVGVVDRPMIGAAKADAARQFADADGVELIDCWAYGDHASDLGLLSAVGHPVVVGGDPVLADHAQRHHWRRLAASGEFVAAAASS
ncbi:HAD family hydrolase [Pseudonocardia spinosispora]|uniref:HAD family hydrolase n=1 Tax=Pseudonocardia spinosispora TaxID=103441 RepID=UPI0007E8E63E|nr:HAD-IB family hydrolase [Pseudonocardia spinosispora]